MQKKIALLLVFIGLIQTSQAQFSYRRKLNPVTKEDWYAITIPADMFRYMAGDYSDVRLLQISANDTIEVPYIMRQLSDVTSETEVNLPVLNRSTKDGKLYLTFRQAEKQAVNYIDLNFDETNFNATIKLQGSHDQKNWFSIIEGERILAIQNQAADFKVTTINFSPSDYEYLRAEISGDRKLTFTGASFKKLQVKAGSFNNADAKFSVTHDKKSKQSVADIRLTNQQPLSTIYVNTKHDADFYRPFRLEVFRDSVQLPNKSWMYNYDGVTSGYITSYRENKFSFPVIQAKRLRLTIDNADNLPLQIETIELSGPEVQMVAKIKPGDYYVFYGNDRLYAPSYDLVHFENQIPAQPLSIDMGAAEKLTAEKQKVSPLFENKWWLWTAMGAIIALLGFATIRMMGKK